MVQHREIVPEVRPHRVLTPGPLSLAPDPSEFFLSAAAGTGVDIVPLGPDTTGLVWLSEQRADELQAILESHPLSLIHI